MEKRAIYFEDHANLDVSEGLEILLREHGYVLSADSRMAGMRLTAKHGTDAKLKIVKQRETCVISYQKKAHFFRGVSLLLQHSDQADFTLEEIPNFESNGIMLDCSRNCVPKTETIKKYIVRLAEFGMNRLYLYMEDTLEIEEYPYWGYLRGRFSKKEMQECDAYASLFGITLVPCIQTLAHLRSALKQPAFAEYRDIDDILLLEDEKSEQLLGSLLRTIAECFSGGLIHLGMDEAGHLGRGRYLEKHGYQEPAQIMKRHLEWLMGVCKSLDLTPIIWSDMYLKLNFGVEDYYSLSEDALPKSEGNLSKDVSLCYWDYYNEGVNFYEKYIRIHQKLGNPIVFAGGAWTWNGVAPGISKAFKITSDALEACHKTGVRDVFCTVWMDNGAEIPLTTVLPLLTLYGEYGFSAKPAQVKIKERFRFCFGQRWEDYCMLDAFDNQSYKESETEGIFELETHNRYCENPSKAILYQDNFMGLLSKMFDEEKLQKQYEVLAKKMECIVKNQENGESKYWELFAYYQTLAELLAKKAGITERIHHAYHTKDWDGMRGIVQNELREIDKLAERLRIQRQALWMKEYKPFGYEILDIRMAGVSARARSAADRLLSFICKEEPSIPELEEEILPYKTPEMLEKELLHGYYMWEKIISAGNVEGV